MNRSLFAASALSTAIGLAMAMQAQPTAAQGMQNPPQIVKDNMARMQQQHLAMLSFTTCGGFCIPCAAVGCACIAIASPIAVDSAEAANRRPFMISHLFGCWSPFETDNERFGDARRKVTRPHRHIRMPHSIDRLIDGVDTPWGRLAGSLSCIHRRSR